MSNDSEYQILLIALQCKALSTMDSQTRQWPGPRSRGVHTHIYLYTLHTHTNI